MLPHVTCLETIQHEQNLPRARTVPLTRSNLSNNSVLTLLMMSVSYPFLWTPKTTLYDVQKPAQVLFKTVRKTTPLWTPKTPVIGACLACARDTCTETS